MTDATMEAIRRSCVELVESIDRVVVRAATQGEQADHTEFEKATVLAMRRLAGIPAIHRLRGRVREASDLEVVSAMTMMADFAAEKDGVQIVQALINAAIQAKKPEVAAQLRKLLGRQVRAMQDK